MKKIKELHINSKKVSLIRGNLIFDHSINAYIVNPGLLRMYAKYFGFTYVEFNVLGSNYLGFFKPKTIFVKELREQFIEWELSKKGNNLKSKFHPTILDGTIIIPTYFEDILLEPSIITTEKITIIIVSGHDQKSYSREIVKDLFAKILQICFKENIPIIGTIPFGQNNLSDPIKGMIDAIRECSHKYPQEIRIFEVNPSIDNKIFSYLENEVVGEKKCT